MSDALSNTGDTTSADSDAQLAQITDIQVAAHEQNASLTQATTAIVDEVKSVVRVGGAA